MYVVSMVFIGCDSKLKRVEIARFDKERKARKCYKHSVSAHREQMLNLVRARADLLNDVYIHELYWVDDKLPAKWHCIERSFTQY